MRLLTLGVAGVREQGAITVKAVVGLNEIVTRGAGAEKNLRIKIKDMDRRI